MCGPDTSNRPRGGALAVLSPIAGGNSDSSPLNLNADLAFHTPGSPSSTGATHARLTPAAAGGGGGVSDVAALSDLHVFIHSTGDLRASIADSGLFRQFALPRKAAAAGIGSEYVELSLDRPLAIEVSDQGIIGRRVSLCTGPKPLPENIVAQGIVGFNFAAQPQASL